jgi:putative endonuclease
MTRYSYIYILTNKINTTLYVGVCEDIINRVSHHKQKLVDGFTKKYNLDKLVYYEQYQDILEAIKREKQLKGGSRKKKVDLIDKMNPEWRDLYEELF